MRRREFVALLGGAVIVAATASSPSAQSQRSRPITGFPSPTFPSIAQDRIAAFESQLRRHGWRRDENVAIDYRWADGNTERFSEFAADLVEAKVDAIVTFGTATDEVIE